MSCSSKSALIQGNRTVVSVNGVVVPHDAISREAQNHPARTPVAAWTAAARALTVRELLLQEARSRRLDAAPLTDEHGRRETDEEALIRTLVDKCVKTPSPDEAGCRRYHESNAARFRSPDIFECSHVLIAARRDKPEVFAAARESALALLCCLQAEPQRFPELARAHSDCPSAASGGNLGQLTAGDTTPEFEKALLALKPGETTAAPVETRYGFHIIHLERRVAGVVLPFDAVRSQIESYLAERSRRVAVAQFIALLAARAELAGVELPSPESLRVH